MHRRLFFEEQWMLKSANIMCNLQQANWSMPFMHWPIFLSGWRMRFPRTLWLKLHILLKCLLLKMFIKILYQQLYLPFERWKLLRLQQLNKYLRKLCLEDGPSRSELYLIFSELNIFMSKTILKFEVFYIILIKYARSPHSFLIK